MHGNTNGKESKNKSCLTLNFLLQDLNKTVDGVLLTPAPCINGVPVALLYGLPIDGLSSTVITLWRSGVVTFMKVVEHE